MPFYFDLSPRGAAGDADATEFVVNAMPRLGGRSVPTPPILFMTPEGEVVGEVSNYATENQVLAAMRKVLDEHAEYDHPGEDEQSDAPPLARARALVDLGRLDAAISVIAKIDTDQARLMRAHIARLQEDWKTLDEMSIAVTDPDLIDDARMEQAYRHWEHGEYEALRDHLADFPSGSNRYTESRYYEGLARYHLGEVDGALELWEVTITGCSQDPWIYRADWAYTGIRQGNKRMFSSAEKGPSLLNRIGYMGRKNPDLTRPRTSE